MRRRRGCGGSWGGWGMGSESDWQETTLGELVDINPENLGAATPADFRFRYVDLSSACRGAINWNAIRELSFHEAPSRARRVTRSGDILYGTVRPALQSHALVDQAYEAIVASTGFAALRVRHGVSDSRFFAHYCLSQFATSEARRFEVGSSYPAVNESDVRLFRVYSPPLPEQRQIAAILDTIDDTIRKTEQIIAKLKQVKQGLLHDLLTRGIDENGELRDPERHPEQFKDSALGRIPRKWEVRSLRALADILDPNPSHRYPAAVESGVPIASTENFDEEDGFDLSGATLVPVRTFEAQYARCKFKSQDVVFARKGRIGFARPYGSEHKVFSHTVVLMKPNTDLALHRFLLWTVRADSFFGHIRDRMNFNVGVPTLGVGFLGTVPILAPPMSEQEAIAKVLDDAAGKIDRERTALSKLRLLKSALMDDLLTGRVRTTALIERGPT